jgi:hypothetical protein
MFENGAYMEYPHAGCAATFANVPSLTPATSVTVFFALRGPDGFACGFFEFTGRFTGTSAPVCMPSFLPWAMPVAVTALGAEGTPLVVTWHPVGDPSWDGWLDFVLFAP